MRLDHLLSGKKGNGPALTAWGRSECLPVVGGRRPEGNSSPFPRSRGLCGGMAQLARASALQAEGRGFEPPCLQWKDV